MRFYSAASLHQIASIGRPADFPHETERLVAVRREKLQETNFGSACTYWVGARYNTMKTPIGFDTNYAPLNGAALPKAAPFTRLIRR